MTLTPEQIKELKSQLLSQIDHLPEDQKNAAREQIEAMSAETLETMLKQQQAEMSDGKTIFRIIAEKGIESHIVEENENNIAVLDINPVSKGHVLIIPKNTITDEQILKKQIESIVNNISERMLKLLKAKTVKLEIEKRFGEYVAHLIPQYDVDVSLKSTRQTAAPEDLKKTLDLINTKPMQEEKPIEPKKQVERKDPPLKLPRSIP